MKEVTVSEVTYQLSPLTLDQGEEIFLGEEKDPKKQNRKMVVYCMNNAVQGAIELTGIGSMPYPTFRALLDGCLEINGFKTLAQLQDAPVVGEAKAAIVH